MIQKLTETIPMDKNGVFKLNTFHLYGGFNRKKSKYSEFIKSSVKLTRPNNNLKKKSKVKSILIYTKKNVKKYDNSYINFKFNSSITLKKRLNTIGREIIGPGFFELKRKRFMSSFVLIL